MALNIHSLLCLEEIQQKDTFFISTVAIGIMEQMKENSFGGTSQAMETPHQTSQRKCIREVRTWTNKLVRMTQNLKLASPSLSRTMHI